MATREDPPSQFARLQSLHGGANTRNAPWILQDTEAEDIQNLDISKLGIWSRRKGAQPFGGLPDIGTSLGHFERKDKDQTLVWGVFGNELYRSNRANAGWDQKACGASFVRDRLHHMVNGHWQPSSAVLNSIYCCQALESSGITEVSMLTAFKSTTAGSWSQHESYAPLAIAYWQARLWKANDQFDASAAADNEGSDLMWSELDDGLTFSPANQLFIEPGVGGPIVALLPTRDSSPKLWVFKENAICLLTPFWGSSSSLIPGAGDELDTIKSSVQVLSIGAGCVAQKSIQWVPGLENSDALFLARDGVRSMMRAEQDVQAGAGLPLTYNIPGWIERINFNNARKAVSAVFDNAYYLAVPMDGSLENSHVLRYDLFQKTWSLHDWQMRDMRVFSVNSEDRFYFLNGFATGDCSVTGSAGVSTDSLPYQMYRAFVGTEDPGASQISYFHTTKAFAFNEPTRLKSWDELMILGAVDAGQTHTMELAYRVDFQDWTTLATVVISVPPHDIDFGADPLPWSQPDRKIVQRRIGLRDVPNGTMIQFKFSDSDDYARPGIDLVHVAGTSTQEIFDNSF
jgi:hypothetical protein